MAMEGAGEVTVATVTLGATHAAAVRELDVATDALRQVMKVAAEHADAAHLVVVFPAGWVYTADAAEPVYEALARSLPSVLGSAGRRVVVVVGVDARSGRDQLSVAVDSTGIVAVGRKFHPTPGERSWIEPASSHLVPEHGKPRIFGVAGVKFFLATCYDVYGIRQAGLKVPDEGVDAVLGLVHGFEPSQSPQYFAKHGFASASKAWGCPVFGATTFVGRYILPDWPTGVMWDQGDLAVQRWKYTHNPLRPRLTLPRFRCDAGDVLMKFYAVRPRA